MRLATRQLRRHRNSKSLSVDWFSGQEEDLHLRLIAWHGDSLRRIGADHARASMGLPLRAALRKGAKARMTPNPSERRNPKRGTPNLARN